MIIKEEGTLVELKVDTVNDRLIIRDQFIEEDGFVGAESVFSIPMEKFKQFLKEIGLNIEKYD